MAELVDFQGQEVYRITNGNSQAWIAPQFGGRLLRWTLGEEELIVWPEDADWSRVTKVRGGNPILFPFIARHMVRGELNKWKDEDTVRDMPMHGFARNLPFRVIEHSESSILMRLEENETTLEVYPFAFMFDVHIELKKDNELRVALKTTNRSDRPMPYYAGHHFYFNVPHNEREQWQINIPCSQTARQKPDGNITFNSQSMVETTLSDPDLIDRFHVLEKDSPITFNKTGDGPSVRIRIDHPETIPWGAVTTWTESVDSDFYCVEPWIGLPNAIHHRHGLRLLEPGADEQAICKIQAEL